MQFSQFKMGEAEDLQLEALRAALRCPGVRLLIDRLPDGLVLVDRDGAILAMNGAAASSNGVVAGEIIGRSLGALTERSLLDWTDAADCYHAGRSGEFLVQGENGRSVLTSIRQFRDGAGEIEMTLIVQRDLLVLDHARRSAVGAGRRELFKFLSDREIAPDFVTQRHISPAVGRVLECGERALRQGARILLMGESGSGKTEIAKYLHRLVDPPETPFVHVNCAAIPESLFESEMFGYEKGAFTGALQTGKRGLIEAAEGGTLFLDEVGEIPLPSQAKLLKFLEDGMVQRIGGRTGRRVKTRVISATNRDLWQMCGSGRFRRDLFYRLAVIPLEVKPLREQPALMQHLIDHFLTAVNQTRERRLRLSAECRARLAAYVFPGNIRELHNIMQQLAVSAAEEATPAHLPPHVAAGLDEAPCAERAGATLPDVSAPLGLPTAELLRDRVRAFEREVIREAILRHGSKRKAARALGVDIGTIVRKTQNPGERESRPGDRPANGWKPENKQGGVT